MKVDIPSDTYGVLPLVANPMKLSGTPVNYTTPPPALGQHTEQVMSDLGLDADAQAALRAAGVI